MSAFCAIIHFDKKPVSIAHLQAMVDAAHHRGPHGQSSWLNKNVGLAHLALNSTPEAASCPQPLYHAEANMCLVADARLDNRQELIPTLLKKGMLNNSKASDGELILAAYQQWGTNCPAHLIGDFAFAIWDGARQRLFGARDPLGVKRLYYHQAGTTLYVASEAAQIVAHPAVKKQFDEAILGSYLIHVTNSAGRSIFQNIYRLSSAHALIATKNDLSKIRYWDIDPNHKIEYRHREEYIAHFQEIFNRAVSARLRSSTLKVGLWLSGGLDSSAIAAMVSQQSQSVSLHPFSYLFNQLPACDERHYIRATTQHLDLPVTEIDTEQFWLLGDKQAFHPRLENPYQGWESADNHVLGQAAEQGIQVFLTGIGGDQLFGGKVLAFTDQLLKGQLSVFWHLAQIRKILGKSYPKLLYYSFLRPLIGADKRQKIRQLMGYPPPPDPIPPWVTDRFIRQAQLREQLARPLPQTPDFHSHALQALYRMTLTSESGLENGTNYCEMIAAPYGIEIRHPFLDRRLLEFVFAIPQHLLIDTGYPKSLIRQAMKGALPEVVRWRRGKSYFTSFIDFSLQKESDYIQDLLQNSLLVTLGWVDELLFQKMIEAYLHREKSISGVDLWPFLTQELWLQHYYLS